MNWESVLVFIVLALFVVAAILTVFRDIGIIHY